MKRLTDYNWNLIFIWAVGPFAVLVVILLLLTLPFMSSDCASLRWICDLFGVMKKQEVVRQLGWTTAGILSMFGILVANRRAKAMIHSAQAQADAVKATETGNRQERFRDAVSHLGHRKASVRQGGAHALFHLALDEEKFRASIAGILCAHIRETTSDAAYQENHKDKPSVEIQSLLQLLVTTTTQPKEDLNTFWEKRAPNLSGGYFCGVELGHAQFRGARLDKAQFQGAVLWETQFQGAILHGAQLQGANLHGAQFQGAMLWEAQLQGANLHETQFQRAVLHKAKLQGANLHEAQFQGAILYGTQLQGADLHEAQFQGAILHKAKLQGVSSGIMDQYLQFEERVTKRVGKDSDFSGVIFDGGLDGEELEKIVSNMRQVRSIAEDLAEELAKDFAEKAIQSLQEKLAPHIGLPASHELPEGAMGGQYDQAQAEEWIREYHEATGR